MPAQSAVGQGERPGRSRMPSGQAVADYWREQGRFGGYGLAFPACFTCRRPADDWSQLERAHLVDRAVGGLDHVANLVMLCWACHRCMPTFEAGEGEAALCWVHTMRKVARNRGGLEVVYAAVLGDEDPPGFRAF